MQELFAKFHLFEISALATAITCLGLAILILKYSNSKLHITWALHNIAVGGWALFVFLAVLSDNPEKAYRFWVISHVFGGSIAVLTFHPTCLFCNFSYPRLMKIAYIYTFIEDLIHIAHPKIFYPSTKLLFNSVQYLQANPLEYLTSLFMWFFLAFFSIYLLFKFASQNKNPKGDQARLFGILSILGYTGGCSTLLPMMEINFYPITMFLLPIYAIGQTYAIFKQQFFGLKVVLEKSLVYSTLITCISILYLTSVVILEKFMRDFLGYNSLAITVGFAFAIGILVVPLRNRIQYYLDKWLFKGTPAEIAQENEYLRKEVAQAEKMKAVATLASGMAHEIRNPLTVIQTFFDQLPAKKDNPEFMRQLNTLVGKEVNRINDLVSQLLEFSKPSPLSLQETDVRKLIEDCLNLLGGQFSKHNIQVVKNFGAGDHRLKADANKLKQVFLNLFMNAIDAMPKGGTLTISVQRSAVSSQPSAKSLQAEGCLLIAVQDTGCGITPNDLKHIFEPFYTTKQKGTGLGLAVCKNIIEEHGGKINASSTVGQGTVFILKFSQGLKKDAN